MTERATQLQEELLRLPAEDRLEIAHILWESVDPPPGRIHETEEEFIAELDRRAAEPEADPSTARPFREVIEELRKESR
jgi:putative addiction module component (TIGR02574 family)